MRKLNLNETKDNELFCMIESAYNVAVSNEWTEKGTQFNPKTYIDELRVAEYEGKYYAWNGRYSVNEQMDVDCSEDCYEFDTEQERASYIKSFR